MRKPLVVVSNLKFTVKQDAGFNTSMEAVEFLNQHIREMLAKAYEAVKADHRKTLMARDFKQGE